ncbi:chromatin structure-remodeling complex protein-like protein rsc1 [Dothidotthia symphoricarpi CBS 119687]|uniref:Chromatin structure-remodeling complex protein-like protein rsc1 n=1 Tax=Dothidotthia symphoricarpi CBS 119687 TaxID=1392245 RepID=A0A6A6AE14_9PLEO|nr:chromatin structure-remodeling complex protein-like protein rsc1 [Dothidotthia symphoricarpi CBS 119687]KAF2130152.1 chromatin structure-remodeling complex protein-like protein rsc1 [Dothidotthia symphoricarpi CBS 119687]
MATVRAPSSTPVPTTETAEAAGAKSTVTPEEWKAMSTVLHNIYAYESEDGYDPTKLFQRKVNKRAVPDYYDIIKEPMALSTIKQNVMHKNYKDFASFVRDLALIPHNAQVYNRQDSQAYVDALEVKAVILRELKKLADEKLITEEIATLPYLGEIPEAEPLPLEEEEEEDDEDDEEELEIDEDEDEDDEDESKRKKRRGPRSSAAIAKRESGVRSRNKDADDAKNDDPESRKKRGRPPRVDTPMEARIKAIMKAIRKPRNQLNKLMVSAFERVPDKTAMPEYHAEIKVPMAMDILKRKLKRKKYNSVDHFMVDVELMFENAKQYNEEESQIYQDAVYLQGESRVIAKIEKDKPDTDFVMEEGRIPMPNGIIHNGELWKVGDWVHIQNTNDLTKPIVAQIYRTWQDTEGGKWVNACWYYRPEQTVHRFDKHFLENEVVKTGQYRDHRIDEVVDRCFVMFVTRYNKGRPRDFPPDKEIYVCEARYNEDAHKFNKIKTWASCLPDEVRDKDYVMDLFDAPRKLKKIPSPIAYLLKDEQTEDDDLPKPDWGAENAPPKIGAVHRRPRDAKDSPPPEPTPPPPPTPPPAPPMATPLLARAPSNGYGAELHRNHSFPQAPTITPMPAPTPQQHHAAPAYTPTHPTHYHSQSPAPHLHQQGSQAPGFQPITPHVPFTPQPTAPMQSFQTPRPTPGYPQQYAQQPSAAYKAPQPVEVYVLNDHANASIPQDIREQFQRDEKGRILFFTAPPLNVDQPLTKEGRALGHSARYLAARAKKEQAKAEKRKADEAGAVERDAAAKKAKADEEEQFRAAVAKLGIKAVRALEDQLAITTKMDFEHAFNGQAKQGVATVLDRLVTAQEQASTRNLLRDEHVREREAGRQTSVTGMTARLEEDI